MRNGALAKAALVLAAVTALGACTTTGQGPSARAPGAGATIAFESVAGPPAEVFRKYVQGLEAEAQARQIAVVSREGPAQYRIRGYLAAHVRRGRTSFVWVWDVYDGEQRRALRIAGEEAGGKGGRNAWAAADEATIRRIAQAGMDKLAVFLRGGEVAPARSGPVAAAPAPATVLARR